MRALWVISLLFLALWLYFALKPRALSQEAAAYFSGEFLEKSLARAKPAYVNSGLSTLASFVVLYLVARWSSRGPILSALFGGSVTPGRAALLGLCLGGGAALLLSVVSLPFGIYGFYLDRAFNLSTMQLPAWLVDYAKNVFLSVATYSLAASFAAWAVARFPQTWHLVLGGSFVVASLVISALYPVLIAPMFNTFHPLPEGSVLQDVRELASAAGMQVDNVLVMEASAKTVRANAYFAGVGATKQLVLYDTLLSSHSREEIRLVVAHELGHWRHGHLVKSVLISSSGVLAALWVFWLSLLHSAGASPAAGTGLTHLAIERLLVTLFVFAALAGYSLSPASSYISRRFEVQSDAYSLALTGDRPAFISSQVNLARSNLGDVDPPSFIRWFAWTHPTTLERIRSASR